MVAMVTMVTAHELCADVWSYLVIFMLILLISFVCRVSILGSRRNTAVHHSTVP